MLTNRQSFRHNRPTTRAHLRRVARVDQDEQRTSFFRFVGQHRLEHPQPRIMCAQGQASIVSHKGQGQVFYRYQAIRLDELCRDLVPDVPSLIGDALMPSGDLKCCLVSSVTTPLPSSKAALGYAQVQQGSAQPAGILNEGIVREGQKVMQAHVNANSRAIVDRGYSIRRLPLETGVPLAEGTFDYDVLDCIRHRPVILDTQLADVLDVEADSLPQPQLTAIAIGVLEGIKALTAFVSRIARRLPCFDAAEERCKGLGQATHGMLQRAVVSKGKIIVNSPRCRELIRLRIVTNRDTTAFPGDAALSQGVVVKAAVNLKQLVQQFLLYAVRVKTILVGADHLHALLGLDILADCLRGDNPCRPDVVASGPQTGHSAFEERELFSQAVRSGSLDAVHNLVGSDCGRETGKEVHVVGTHYKLEDFTSERTGNLWDKLYQPIPHLAHKCRATVLGAKNEVIVDIVGSMSCLHRSNYTLDSYELSSAQGRSQGAFLSRINARVPCA